MAIYERLAGLIHRFAQFGLFAVRKPDGLEPAQKFFAGDADFAPHDGNPFAVTLDFNHLATMDDVIQDALAFVGHVGC